MPDNIIRVGNTPIFEELVREMGARHFKSLLSPSGALRLGPVDDFTYDLPKPSQEAQKAWVSAAETMAAMGSWIAKPVPVISPRISETFDSNALIAKVVGPPVEISKEEAADLGIDISPRISETFDPNALIEQAINPQLRIQQIVKKFCSKWPNASSVHITRMDNIDGTITIIVSEAEMVEQTDESVNADPKPAAVKPLSEVCLTSIPDMITTSKVDFEKKRLDYFSDVPVTPEMQRTIDRKRKPDTIGEDVADVLYMKPSAWGSNEE